MAKCDITCYMVARDPYLACSDSITKCRCNIHNWEITEPISYGGLCPIGRIEEATEKAIEKINDHASLS